jgi:hypothetical protein
MDLARQIAAAVFVIVLLVAALHVLRHCRGRGPMTRWGGGSRSQRRLETVDRLALDSQHVLHLIRVDGRELLLAVHGHGCALIERIGEPVGGTCGKGAGAC